ncbi:MAG: alpha/beta fold hydrolase [Desulfatibacillaceae bacterium]
MRELRRLLLLSALFLILSACGALVRNFDVPDPPPEQGVDRYVTVGCVSHHYLEWEGAKDTIFLLHGFSSSTYTWEDVAPRLAGRGYRVVALDMKGFGWSDKPPGADYGPETLAREVIAFMDAVGIDRPVFVGNSLGGMIAILCSLEQPSRFDRLVLIDPAAYPKKTESVLGRNAGSPGGLEFMKMTFCAPMVEGFMLQVFHDDSLVTPERVTAYFDRLRVPGGLEAQDAVLVGIRELRERGFHERLEDVRAETLLIWGAEDRWIPVENGCRLRQDIPGAELVIIPECGHVPQEEAPEKTASLIAAFASGVGVIENTHLCPPLQ